MVDSVSVRLKNARVENMPVNIRIQWNAGTACVSECVLKTLAFWGLRVGPFKILSGTKRQPKKFRAGYPTDVLRSFARTSRVKNFGQALETLENKHWCADIDDTNARTSMTPGRCTKTSGRKISG